MRRAILALLVLPLAGPAAQPLLPLPQAVALVAARYHGRMIEARVVPGREDERTAVAYELRWLTPANDVLRIRVSALDGAMLLVEGSGMIAARK
ncbi:hypothetical protein [Falsiroseomonas sp.]|uniref:hypothetical protein n=1 Tax=Falsiroseomonas sp. TaxID=2870721 RepID=UPI003F6F7D58